MIVTSSVPIIMSPRKVEEITLNNGYKIPVLGLGTWQGKVSIRYQNFCAILLLEISQIYLTATTIFTHLFFRNRERSCALEKMGIRLM